MAFLIDTNIILRMAQPEHPMCAEALNALAALKKRKENYYLTTQNLIEYWRTCTRPIDRNGLVAAMLVHRLTHILTFNTSDFIRYTEVTVVHPTEFSSQQA